MKQQKSTVAVTSRFINLRHTSKEMRDGVMAVGTPAARGLGGFSHLFLTEGGTEFVYNGTDLYVVSDSRPCDFVGRLPSAPLSCVALSADRFMVNCADTTVTVVKGSDGKYSIVTPVDFAPDVRFAVNDVSNVEVGVDECQLADTYDLHSTELSLRDSQRLETVVKDAMKRLEEAAVSANRLIHPVMVRYRLSDAAGTTVYVSAPVLIGSEVGGVGFPLRYVHPSATKTLAPSRLGASGYGVNVVIGGDSRLGHVAKLTVEMTPQLDAAQIYDRVRNRFARRADGTFELEVSMDCYRDDSGIIDSLVYEAIDRDDRLFRAVAVVANPFDGGKQSVVAVVNRVSADAVVKSQEPVVAADNATVAMSVPNVLTATAASRVGDVVMLANAGSVRFRGYGVGAFALTTADTPWRAATSVRVSGGRETVVMVEEGSAGCPVTLTPVLSYPSGDAVEMTVTIQSGDRVVRRSFALRPSLSGRHSIYVEPSLRPIDFNGYETESFVVEADTSTACRRDGVAATVTTGDIGKVVSAVRISDRAISAIVPATGSSAGWDHVRGRFYLFSGGGTSVATVGKGAVIAAVATIDVRGVSSREAVVTTSDHGTLALTDSGDLISVRGVSARFLDHTGGRGLAYDATRRELWIVDSDDALSVAVRSMDHGDYYRRTLPSAIVRTNDTPSGSIVETEDDLSAISGDEHDGEVEIEMTERRDFSVVCPAGARRRKGVIMLRSVTFDIDCQTHSRLTLELRRDHGAGIGETAPVARFDIDGKINSPLLFNCVSPVSQGLVTVVKGTTRPSTIIRSVTLMSNRQ